MMCDKRASVLRQRARGEPLICHRHSSRNSVLSVNEQDIAQDAAAVLGGLDVEFPHEQYYKCEFLFNRHRKDNIKVLNYDNLANIVVSSLQPFVNYLKGLASRKLGCTYMSYVNHSRECLDSILLQPARGQLPN